MKIQKKMVGGRGRGRGEVWEGGQGGCDRRIEVFGKIHKKNWGGRGGLGRAGGGGRVGVCVCDGGGGGFRVDANKELMFL